MTLNAADLRELQNAIADRIFIQVANWNLYLGDAGLAKELAIECSSLIDKGAHVAARRSLESIHVDLGGGSMRVPLAQLVSSAQTLDLEDLLSPYCN